MSREVSTDATRVIHIGVVGNMPGGMAQVVNEYLTWTFERVRLSAWASTTKKHDVFGILRWAAVVSRLISVRFSKSKSVVVVHLSQGGSFVREGALVWVARALGLAVVAHIHGSSFEQFSSRRSRLVRLVLRRANRVLVLTKRTESSVKKVLGSIRVPVVIVPNAVRLQPVHPKRTQDVVFAGEVGTRKGVDVLIAAWKAIPESSRSGWRLKICGPIASDFSTFVGTNQDPAVEARGTIGHDELGLMLRSARIAVLPSRNEALPMFLLEAMARGVATVSTPVGEIATLLRDDAGIIVPTGDISALATAMQKLMDSPEESEALGARGRERVAALYSAEVIGAVLEEQWLLAARKTRQ